MSKEMLIESCFPEETRIAVVEKGNIIALDVSTSTEKQIRGNIYLGIVSRIEPGLQAIFVDYGEEKKGFLPFDYVHVNYYDLPKEDLESLREQVKRSAENECETCKKLLERIHRNFRTYESKKIALLKLDLSTNFVEKARKEIEEIEKKSLLKKIFTTGKKDELILEEPDITSVTSVENFSSAVISFAKKNAESANGHKKEVCNSLQKKAENYLKDFSARNELLKKLEALLNSLHSDLSELSSISPFRDKSKEILRSYVGAERRLLEVGSVGNPSQKDVPRILKEMALEQDSMENELKSFGEKETPLSSYGRRFLQKKYSVQEVIKRGDLMVVQVVKEERGNKGALLTTYLSLAGRYCILMPNTSKKYGISRKIRDMKERQKLRKIISSFQLRPEMSIILRTAGKSQEESTIRDDVEHLLKIWNKIVEITTKSQAPSLVHEGSGQLVRAIRDICTSDVKKIIVQGDEAFEETRRIARLISPPTLQKVIKSDSSHPLFVEKNIEGQVVNLENSHVRLKSGGYLVINFTEALTAIDVNSGQSNQNHSVEATALKNNLEAGAEVIRQLILRDIGGLIVVDLIDMENTENIRSVERVFREHVVKDNARVKILPISQLGILEMSRQRKQNSLDHILSRICPSCQGEGRIPSLEHKTIKLIREIHGCILKPNKGLKELEVYTAQAIESHISKKYKDHMARLREIRPDVTISIKISTEEGRDRVKEIYNLDGKKRDSRPIPKKEEKSLAN